MKPFWVSGPKSVQTGDQRWPPMGGSSLGLAGPWSSPKQKIKGQIKESGEKKHAAGIMFSKRRARILGIIRPPVWPYKKLPC